MLATALRSNLRVFRNDPRRPGGHKSLRAAARELGVSPSTLSEWEHGKHFPSLEDALRVAAYYGTPVEALFQLEGNTPA